jgi:uncharacterized protein YlxW (UPF0749 family)
MKKKVIIGLLVTALFAGGATAVFATDSQEVTELKELYAQMTNLQKQIVDTQAKAGNLTENQAKTMKERIDQNTQYRSQAIEKGQFNGPGFGGRMGNGGCCGDGYGFNSGPAPTAKTNF